MTRDTRFKLQNIPLNTEEGRRIRTAFFGPQSTTLTMHSETSLEIRIFAELLVRNVKERNSR